MLEMIGMKGQFGPPMEGKLYLQDPWVPEWQEFI
jgi:hypothetical protein